MKTRWPLILSYYGGMAAASAFHEFGHHEWTISTTLAVVTASAVVVFIVFFGNLEEQQ